MNQFLPCKDRYVEEILGAGGNGVLYKICDGYVAKFLLDEQGNLMDDDGRLWNEHMAMNQLYEEGISIPEAIFYGEIPLTLEETGEKEYIRGMIRRYVDGIEIYKAEYEEWIEAKDKMYEELDRARELGFKPGGDAKYPVNAILTPDGDVVLIDMGEWEARY